MWYDYGRKIINAIFKKRSDSTTIRAEFGSKLQADSDRSDIRVFETGLSIEQYGNYEQSTGTAAQESESARIVAIAKANGLFIDKSEWHKFGERKRLPSGESIVFINDREDVITKIRNPFAKSVIKGLHAYDVIYEHLIHNILFPNSRYKFIGISEDSGNVRFILQQRYLSDKFITPSQSLIDTYLMQGLGLKIENRYYYANNYIAITDVSASSDNVLFDGKQLYFIDPIIKFKQPAMIVLDYYYQLLK
jgi:hypothetical protein